MSNSLDGDESLAAPAPDGAATPAQPAWYDVCRADRLSPDRGVAALVADKQVAIFRIGTTGELFAISNYDPFSHAFVLARGIVGSKGDIFKVASPVYKQTFNLRTGECLEDPAVRVPVYPVRVALGMVQVNIPGAPSSPAPVVPQRASGPLSGLTIAISETRERVRLIEMLAGKGATVVSCPVVATADPVDTAPVESWLRSAAEGELDFCVFYTGEGIRRLFAMANRLGIETELLGALGKAQTIARGPKSARALREVGLLPTLALDTPTTEGIIDLLRSKDWRGTRIGVQLYPRASSKRLLQFLRGEGAGVRPVWPYEYADAGDDAAAKNLVARLVSGHIDMMVFTSRAQVDRLFSLAARLELEHALVSGLRRTRIATIGPIVAGALRARSLKVSIVPAELFFMKSLVKEIVAAAHKTTHSAA